MRISKKGRTLLLGSAFLIWSSSAALAVPYASGLSELGGTVSFILNQDSDSVVIKRAGQADENLGGLTKGTQSFSLNGASSYEIVVSKSTSAGYTQVSDDTEVGSNFFSPRGVAINQNPASTHFGNIYVSEGIGGVVTKEEIQIRDTLDGLFVMGADQSDIISQGDDGRIGGLDTSGSNSPFKITVAPDDSIYIADWSDATGGVYRAPADLSVSTNWPNVLANDNRNPDAGGLTDNHGSVSSVWVEGTGSDTKLYTMDEDWPDANGINAEGRGDIFRYDIGTATNVTDAPIVQVDDASTGPGGTASPAGVILNGLMDFVRDEDGTWWTAQFRSDDEQSVPALSHWADGATEPLFVSGKNPRTPSDFNFDSDVDGDDFLVWQRNNGNPGNAFTGDASGDGNVDGADLVIWDENYGDLQPAGIVLDGVYGDLDIHNDRDLLVLGTRFGQGIYVVDISDPANPVIAETILHNGDRVEDVAFDIAGNIYAVSRGAETLRIFSPGGDTVAVTGSDGSFVLNPPLAFSAVPEPGSIALCLLGVVCLSGWKCRL